MTHDAHRVISLDPSAIYLVAAVTDALDDAGESATVLINTVFPGTTQAYSVKPLVGYGQSSADLPRGRLQSAGVAA
jgi:hypothetical protein